MGNLGETLKNRIKSMGITRQVEAVGVVETAQKEIAKHVPEEDFEIVSFNRGVLKIRTKNSSASCQIQSIFSLISSSTNSRVTRIKFSQ